MAQPDTGRDLGVSTSRPTLDGLTVGGTALGTAAIVELGQAATDKVALWGVTASVQYGTIGTVASGTATTTATFGAGGNPDIVTLFTAVNSITAALRNAGIIKT